MFLSILRNKFYGRSRHEKNKSTQHESSRSVSDDGTISSIDASSIIRSADSSTVKSTPINPYKVGTIYEPPSLASIMPVIESWGKVQQIPNYAEVVSELLFRKFFELEPRVLKIFPFYLGADRMEEMYQSKIFRKHSLKVASTFEFVVSNLLDLDEEYMIELGRRHAQYSGVRQQYFPALGQAVLATLQAGLGNAAFTPELRHHWTCVFNFIAYCMIEGLNRARFM